MAGEDTASRERLISWAIDILMGSGVDIPVGEHPTHPFYSMAGKDYASRERSLSWAIDKLTGTDCDIIPLMKKVLKDRQSHSSPSFRIDSDATHARNTKSLGCPCPGGSTVSGEVQNRAPMETIDMQVRRICGVLVACTSVLGCYSSKEEDGMHSKRAQKEVETEPVGEYPISMPMRLPLDTNTTTTSTLGLSLPFSSTAAWGHLSSQQQQQCFPSKKAEAGQLLTFKSTPKEGDVDRSHRPSTWEERQRRRQARATHSGSSDSSLAFDVVSRTRTQTKDVDHPLSDEDPSLTWLSASTTDVGAASTYNWTQMPTHVEQKISYSFGFEESAVTALPDSKGNQSHIDAYANQTIFTAELQPEVVYNNPLAIPSKETKDMPFHLIRSFSSATAKSYSGRSPGASVPQGYSSSEEVGTTQFSRFKWIPEDGDIDRSYRSSTWEEMELRRQARAPHNSLSGSSHMSGALPQTQAQASGNAEQQAQVKFDSGRKRSREDSCEVEVSESPPPERFTVKEIRDFRVPHVQGKRRKIEMSEATIPKEVVSIENFTIPVAQKDGIGHAIQATQLA